MATRSFSANIPPPEKMSFSGSLAENWRKFKRNFNNYSVATRLSREPDLQYQTSVLLSIIGPEAFDVYEGLQFTNDEDPDDIKLVIEKFEEFFVGETHEAYESYRFHLRKQEHSENIETYITALRRLAKNCNFGELTNRMIRDQVVVGVKDDMLREKLLADKTLTLDKCLQIGRAHETSRQQTKSISTTNASATEPQINRVTGKNKKYPFKKKKQKKQCHRCGAEPHSRPACKAITHECEKCKIVGHYPSLCRNRAVRGVTEEESNFLGSI